jgi:hypothetical protein
MYRHTMVLVNGHDDHEIFLEGFLGSNGMVDVAMGNVAMTLDFWNFGLQTL